VWQVDGKELPIALLRGSAKGSGADNTTIDFADAAFGVNSGLVIGTIATQNRSLVTLNLKANRLGAEGVVAVVDGLSDAPLRTLDVTRNALGGGEERRAASAEITALSESICRNLGSLVDLRMDENDLDCPASSLAPLCKLRHLRTLSWEKNRLSELPTLIGTMLSLRRLLVHNNALIGLPDALSLLVHLEHLDAHKNAIARLPPGIGSMRALQKLDLSENRLTELPVAICELSDDLQLLVGRNPLEKPPMGPPTRALPSSPPRDHLPYMAGGAQPA
jgi:hypothetical protein